MLQVTSKGRVLIVDDELASRTLLGELVRLQGFEALLADGGADALEIIGRGAVDVVLLDLMMPGVSGLDVLEQLDARGLTPALPVVVISAFTDRESRLKALDRGAIDFLNKPVDRHEVSLRLRTLVRMKRLQDELVTREERLRVTLQTIGDAVLATDADGHVTQLNPVAEALTGWTEAEAIGRPVAEILHVIHQLTRGLAQIPVTGTLTRGAAVELANDVALIARGGTERPIGASCAPIRSSDGRVIGTVLVFRDVTKEHEAKRSQRAIGDKQRATNEALEQLVAERTLALREKEAFLRDAQRLAHIGSFRVDLATNDGWWWSTETYRIFGLDEATFTGKHFDAYRAAVHPDDRARVKATTLRPLGDGSGTTHEFRIVRADGQVRNLVIESELVLDPTGRPVRLHGAVQDVTERKEGNARLEEAVRRLELATQSTQIGVFDFSVADNKLVWDEQMFRIFGTPKETFQGSVEDWTARVHPDDLAQALQEFAKAMAGTKEFHTHFRVVRPDGQVRHVSGDALVLRAGDGTPTRMIGVNRDITERVDADIAAQTALREKELLLKEIHHRVKNNLQIISSLLAMQADEAKEPGTRAALKEGVHRVRSMALIHERLYQSDTLARIDFGEYTEALAGFLFRSYSGASAVKLVVDVSPAHVNIETAVPCGLILNELVSNAFKHAFKDGRAGELHVTVKPDAEGRVRLEVRDTGPGLPPSFAIDKAESLGLQLVASLTKQIKGALTISNEGGASFVVSFAELTYAAR